MGIVIDSSQLRVALAERGLLQKDLAKLAGVSEGAVSASMRGRPIRAVTFARIARGLASAPVVNLADVRVLIRGDDTASVDTQRGNGPSSKDRP